MQPATFALLVAAAYLAGAIPFGLLIGLARGVDIRRHGSRNIGATNTGRVLGKKWGYLCLALDVLKGFAPVFAAAYLLPRAGVSPAAGLSPTTGMSAAVGLTPAFLGQWLCVAVAAVLGHVFPVYLGFRGGKGVSTTIGVALGVFPYLTVAMGVALVGYVVVRKTTGYASAGSLAIAVVFPAAFGVYVAIDPATTMAVFWPLQAVAVALGVLIVVRHMANIRRLLRGEEQRMA